MRDKHHWLFSCRIHEAGLWFRVFGYGLSIRDRRKYRPLFSERYGYRRIWYIGWLSVEALKR